MIQQSLAVYRPCFHQERCGICLERGFSMIAHRKMVPTNRGPQLSCYVHERCLKAWLRQVTENPHCPTCRSPVDPEQLPSRLRKRKIKKLKENMKDAAVVTGIALVTLGPVMALFIGLGSIS